MTVLRATVEVHRGETTKNMALSKKVTHTESKMVWITQMSWFKLEKKCNHSEHVFKVIQNLKSTHYTLPTF